MTREEFEKLISEDPALATPIHNAVAAIPRSREAFGTVTELAAIVILFPVVKYIVTDIGLPWLYEAKRYTELWRLKFHRWIDEQHQKHDLDPDAAEAACNALRRELEAIKETKARKSWERFASLLSKEKPDEGEEDT